jgi:MFS family permease
VSEALRGHRDFRTLWAARTVSMMGGKVTLFAIPFTAAITLRASPMQVAVLTAAGFLPWMLCGVAAGVYIDRFRRRAIMIGSDYARAVLLLLVPGAYVLDVLSFALLVTVAALLGVLDVVSHAASLAYLPTVVTTEELPAANSALAVSTSVSDVAGPGLAGALIDVLTAPIALVADAISFVVSAVLLERIKTVEPPLPAPDRHDFRAEATEGLAFLWRHPVLRTFVCAAAVSNLGASMNGAVVVLFAVDVLHLSAGEFGLTAVFFGIGGVLAGAASGRLTRRFGAGPVIVGSSLTMGVGGVLSAFAGGSLALVWAALSIAYLLRGGGLTTFVAVSTSLRQALIPNHLRGRAMASASTVMMGVNPVGALLGGVLATWFGLRGAMLAAGVLLTVATGWLLRSPMRTLRALGDADEAELSPR